MHEHLHEKPLQYFYAFIKIGSHRDASPDALTDFKLLAASQSLVPDKTFQKEEIY